ncbi:hypothetical protein [Lysobacter sp. F60174L2]|uniref:hypothetical protein n=1 Tax=Lysobacter sp. F60174L2 TaxID=3459295 RepID=UPI00403DBABD
MNLIQFLAAQLPTLRADQINVHFAKIDSHGTNPADEFKRGNFNDWQRNQPLNQDGDEIDKIARKRFTRSVVVGLIPQ